MQNRPVFVVPAIALTVLTVGCSGSVDTTSKSVADPTSTTAESAEPDNSQNGTTSESGNGVFEIPEALMDQAAEDLSVSKDSLEFNEPFGFGASGCFLQTAFSSESSAFGSSFAVLEDGDVLKSGDSASVSTILELCFFGAGNNLTADEWAELIVRLDATPVTVRVMTPELSFEAEDLGKGWSEPQIGTDGRTSTLTFLAYGVDFGDVYEVTATRAADGTFSSSYDQALPG